MEQNHLEKNNGRVHNRPTSTTQTSRRAHQCVEEYDPQGFSISLARLQLTHPICSGNLCRVFDIFAGDAAGFVETTGSGQNYYPAPLCTSVSSFLRNQTMFSE